MKANINRMDKSDQSRKISRVLLELAEKHLTSPETRHLISEEGMERVRQRLI